MEKKNQNKFSALSSDELAVLQKTEQHLTASSGSTVTLIAYSTE